MKSIHLNKDQTKKEAFASPKLVFVDIDGTLISPSSVLSLLQFCIKNKILPYRVCAYACYHYIQNYFNQFNHSEVIAYWLKHLSGIQSEDFRYYCHQTFDLLIRYHFIPSMLEKISEHQRQGDYVILISSTFHHFAELIVNLLQLNGYSSLEVLLHDNKLTQKTIIPIPYHQGKIYYALAYAKQFNLSLTEAFFYSDSISDLPLLESVGNPMIINPDRHLNAIALQHQWNIIRDKKTVDIYDFLKGGKS